MKYILFISLLILTACQKVTFNLANVDEPEDKIEYTQELRLKDSK